MDNVPNPAEAQPAGQDQGTIGRQVDDLVPAAGKHAARPSQAEQQQELHEYPQTNPEALRQEGLEPGEERYRVIEDNPLARGTRKAPGA